jgi:glucose/arabinose dehydrogenase/PKD repeat protein
MATSPSRHAGRAFFIALALAGRAVPSQAALPPNFVDEPVAAVTKPTALAFTPDGRLLIASQDGSLYVHQNGALLPTPALTFPSELICTNSERGLVGVAVDPDFVNTQYIYLFYTFRNGAPVCDTTNQLPKNRVSRFVLPPGNVVSLDSEMILVDNLPSPVGNRNGGDLQFGRDGFLYISVGDGGVPSAARDEHVLAGKILRMTRGGGIPPTNPFQGTGTLRCSQTGSTTPGNRCRETFAWGLRNPWRIAFDPNAAGSAFRINDVGQLQRDEINNGLAGADYGWNCREGSLVNPGGCTTTPPNMVGPIFDYARVEPVPGTTAQGCNALTGGAFVPNGLWPGYDGTYLFGDFVCRFIFRLSAGTPHAAADFAPEIGKVVAMAFGPYEGRTRALYYTSYDNGVRRIRYAEAGNRRPTAVASASPLGGPVPLTVTFDATGSNDPDDDFTLIYFWNFGDGTPEISTPDLTIQHTYVTARTYAVTLRTRDEKFAFSEPVTVLVQPGNNPPVVTISTPGPSDTFRVGQVVNLTGSATDLEDGALAPSRMSWTVVLHHAGHTHPFLGPTFGNPVPMTCPAPENVNAGADSHLEVRLTATDLSNLATSVSRVFQPRKVSVMLDTVPTGLVIPANGFHFTTPATITSWPGYVITVDAPDQMLGGNRYTWQSWSDTGLRTHAINTGEGASTHVATFDQLPPLVLRYFTLSPCRLVDTRGPAGPLGGPALSSGVTRTFDLDGVCNVPATARALAVNVTAVQGTSFGSLQMWAGGSLQPSASVINFAAGQGRANNGIVSLGPTGTVNVSAIVGGGGTVHFILDVVGFFQ